LATITGTDAGDVLFGTDAADVIRGRAGGDLLVGDGGDDTLLGGAGDDTLIGGGGDDVLRPGANVVIDIVRAGAGDDVIVIETGGGRAQYEFDYGGLTGPIEVAIGFNRGDVSKGGGEADVWRGLKFAKAVSVLGTGGDDVFAVERRAGQFTQIDPGAGADEIVGGVGYERLFYGDKGFFGAVSGGVSVTVASSRFAGMTGTVVDPFGSTDSFADIDEIRGTQWTDRFVGSSGVDHFIPEIGNDFINGRGGFDIVRYDIGVIDRVVVDLAQKFARVQSEGVEFRQTLRSIEEVRGSFNADVLRGDKRAEILIGGSGDDSIQGRGGADVIVGGAGDDTLAGGNGSDTFEFRARHGDDVIRDFDRNLDKIAINANRIDDFADLSVSAAEGGTQIAFANTSVLLLGLQPGQIVADLFEFA
jgi:Ca2+-binding RTX toxin-like protein